MTEINKVERGLNSCCDVDESYCGSCPYFDTDAERIARALAKKAGLPDEEMDTFCQAFLHSEALNVIRELKEQIRQRDEHIAALHHGIRLLKDLITGEACRHDAP